MGGVDSDSENNTYISKNPYLAFTENVNSELYFVGTRYYGTGGALQSSQTQRLTLTKVQTQTSTWNMNAEPHVFSMFFVTLGDSDDLFVKGKMPEDLVTISQIQLPDIDGARYIIRRTIDGYFPGGSGFLMTGWQGCFITFFSYPSGTENYDQAPRFTEGQQITFNLTMKKPNGEVILDNKAITLNFT